MPTAQTDLVSAIDAATKNDLEKLEEEITECLRRIQTLQLAVDIVRVRLGMDAKYNPHDLTAGLTNLLEMSGLGKNKKKPTTKKKTGSTPEWLRPSKGKKTAEDNGEDEGTRPRLGKKSHKKGGMSLGEAVAEIIIQNGPGTEDDIYRKLSVKGVNTTLSGLRRAVSRAEFLYMEENRIHFDSSKYNATT